MAAQSALYEKIQSTYEFTDYEMKRLDYTLSVFKCECSKLVILAVVFAVWGRFPEYLVVLLTLLPVRRYSGGIHFNHYRSCFLFTTLFLMLPVLLNSIVFPLSVQLIVLAFNIGITYAVGPVTSQKRPPLEYKKYRQFRYISTGFLLVWLLVFAFVREFPFENLCFWVLTLQTIQLICARIARKGEIYEKAE